MIKALLGLFLLTIVSSSVLSQTFDSLYGKPNIVLIETDPWLSVIGSDVPLFVMYANRQIIYRTVRDKSVIYMQVTLSNLERAETIESLKIPDGIYELPSEIEASYSTDQPENILMLDVSETKKLTVYGDLKEGSESRSLTPNEFLMVYDNIKKYENTTAKEWLPNKIEVLLRDYGNASSKKAWLDNLPDLKSPATIKRSNSLYSVYIDKSDFGKFKRYYNSLRRKQAVEINGLKMALSYRFPFPNVD